MNTPKSYALDVLRAFAITLVFLFHYGRLFPHPEFINTISKFGWTGVDLFFVLSGFLIGGQLLKEQQQTGFLALKPYFIKRTLRILPAYFIVLLVYIFIPFAREREGLAPVWKYVFFVQNISLDISKQGTFSHAWSLCIEEQFYLALPLLMILFIKMNKYGKAWLLLLALWLSMPIVRHLCYHSFVIPYGDSDTAFLNWYEYIYYPTYTRLDGLVIGVLAAVVKSKIFPRLPDKKYFAIVGIIVGLAALSVAYYLCLDETSYKASVYGFSVVSIGYGVLLLSSVSVDRFLVKLKSNAVIWVAKLSYLIYLIHKIVIHLTQVLLPDNWLSNDSWLMFIIATINVIGVALLLHYIIETPFQKLRETLLH